MHQPFIAVGQRVRLFVRGTWSSWLNGATGTVTDEEPPEGVTPGSVCVVMERGLRIWMQPEDLEIVA